MFKKNLFRSAVVANGKTLRDVACALGINEVTLSRKIHGKSDFTRNEIQIIRGFLNLSYDDVESIFFGE